MMKTLIHQKLPTFPLITICRLQYPDKSRFRLLQEEANEILYSSFSNPRRC